MLLTALVRHNVTLQNVTRLFTYSINLSKLQQNGASKKAAKRKHLSAFERFLSNEIRKFGSIFFMSNPIMLTNELSLPQRLK